MRAALAICCILAVLVPLEGMAQDCTIAAYADPAGAVSIGIIEYDFAPVYVYVVLFAEDTVAAAAYSMVVPPGMFMQSRQTGPSGEGLALDGPGGTNAELGECVAGLGGAPVLVDEYYFLALPTFWNGVFAVGPNTDQDPELPQYVNCVDLTRECTPGPDLEVVAGLIPTDARSFGTIKSLFR